MSILRLSMPLAVDLTEERNWKTLENVKNTYWIVRCHFQIRERQTDAATKVGNKLAAVESPTGVGQELMRSITTEYTSVQLCESFVESIREEESINEFATTLGSTIGSSNTGKISSKLKETVRTRLSESFKKSYRVRNVVTKRIEETYELKSTVDPSVTDRLLAVAVYQQYAYDLYLTWVDHLTVTYEKTLYGLRKKRTKMPVPQSNVHPNWIKFNMPLVSALFWKPLPRSSLIVSELKYKNEVGDPESITISPLDNPHEYVAIKPDVPSLYQLANVAFPLRWIHRKGDWTEADLMKIEEEEAVDSHWFWQHGPGKNKKQ